jgi:hypothetical protein
MLQVTPQSKVFIATEPVDFRKGIDGIAAICRQKLSQNPLEGAMFVFRNRSKTTIKILCYDGQGFWLCTKRLSMGRFIWWPTEHAPCNQVSYRELYTLIHNGNPATANYVQDWRPLQA